MSATLFPMAYRMGIEDKSILTTKEVAEYFNLHRLTIYGLVAEGKLHPFKIGRLLRFDRSEVLVAAKNPNLPRGRKRKLK